MTAYVAFMFGVCVRVCVCDFDDRLINILEPKRVLVASALRYSYCRTFTHRCCRLSSVCLYTVLCMYVRTFIVCLKVEVSVAVLELTQTKRDLNF